MAVLTIQITIFVILNTSKLPSTTKLLMNYKTFTYQQACCSQNRNFYGIYIDCTVFDFSHEHLILKRYSPQRYQTCFHCFHTKQQPPVQVAEEICNWHKCIIVLINAVYIWKCLNYFPIVIVRDGFYLIYLFNEQKLACFCKCNISLPFEFV